MILRMNEWLCVGWTDGEADWESAKMVVGHCAERAAEGAGGSAEAGAVQPLSAVLLCLTGHCLGTRGIAASRQGEDAWRTGRCVRSLAPNPSPN